VRLVVVETPYAGEVAYNVAFARACMKYCFSMNWAPFASHLLYAQSGILNNQNPKERRLGIESGFEWREFADMTVVFKNLGISKGMELGIEDSMQKLVPVKILELPDKFMANILDGMKPWP